MISRPPKPEEVLAMGEFPLLAVRPLFDVDIKQIEAMQEALTVNWLIEQGFMPDPSEFNVFKGEFWICEYESCWVCEDRT